MNKKRSLKQIIIILSSILVSTIMAFILVIVFFVARPSNIDGVKTIYDYNGNQIITLHAKDGFSPKVSVVDAGKPTILKVDTNNTVDCSATINIPHLKINDTLLLNGVKDFNIPTLASGEIINGTCGGGIYSFKIIAQ